MTIKLHFFRHARLFLGLASIVCLCATPLLAQVGNDNPTGVSGMYNGNVSTAGSYDPYTGNATRSITDLSVAGGVGAYPLAFTRTMNSRYTPGAGALEFGASGSWRHSYQWTLEPYVISSSAANKWTVLPGVYNVNYPDGRRISFATATNGDTRFRGGPGISDRFQQLAAPEGGDCYLLLPDGGKVWFDATVTRMENEKTHVVTSTFTYQLMGIIDPHGQTTSVTYGANTMTIQEPAGRTLTLYYISMPWNGNIVIDRVVASDGRSVKYNYGGSTTVNGVVYTSLGNVQYLDTSGASYAQAIYAYQASNVDPNGRLLLYWAIDPMYAGPMWAISYSFVPVGSGGVYGQLQSENYLDPFTGTPGQVVSSLSVNGNSRTETRGDGPTRTFTYSGGKLVSYTNFRGQSSSISYDGNGFTSAFTDARGKTTTTLREGLIGALSLLTHPDTEHSTQGYSYLAANGAPYYLQIRGDERTRNTYFTRDQNNFQLTRIDYPDYPNGAYETFAYNGFGQVYSHRMTSGGIETRYFDGRGMMWASNNPDGTTYYYYDGQDRLEHVTDPRSKTTWFQYNTRGQVTRVTHMDSSYLQYGYNVDGTLAWTADENHPGAATDASQRTRYAYDIYKRVVSVTNPLNQTTSCVYAQDWSNAYNQTTTNPKGAFSPMGRQVHYAYDENWQRTIMRVPPTSDPNSDTNDAWTFYAHDAAGNLYWTQDPRGYATNFGYDERNRKIWMTDPIASDRNSTGHTVDWQYDTTSNLIRETRADNSYRTIDYDSMNRVIDTHGFANEHTHYGRDLAGNITQMIDAKAASYGFGYDQLNRKTSATYPDNARTETWQYDGAGNMNLYKNPAGLYRHLFYDDRNRIYDAWWDNGAAPEIVVGYDFASRVTSVVTNTVQTTGETIVSFGYDAANRKIWEDQTLSGYPTRRVSTPGDADGNRSYLEVAGYYHTNFTYNQRNQLATITNLVNFASFAYDANGNMTNREGRWAYDNATNFAYDEVNRVSQIQYGNASTIYLTSHYQYDNLSREVATWRDEQSSKGERFGYDAIGQLTSVAYNADQVWTGTPLNATRNVTYTLDSLNRQSVTDNNTATGYSPNAMNQYTQWAGQTINYDGNFNFSWMGGWQYNYDAANHLTSIGNGGGTQESFVYDGLGRCVKRTLNGSATVYTYDGWKPLLELDGAGNFLAWNMYGAGPDEILGRYDSSGRVSIYKQDQHSNVVAVLDQNGDVTEKYTYDAFGIPSVFDKNGNSRSGSAIGNRFMFQGREWYPEIGLYNFRNRFYDPTIGRFIQPDPLGFGGGDANLFRFCGGDPVNGSDPSGLLEKTKPGGKSPPPIRPYEPTQFGSNGYIPTGSHIPQSVFGVPNGPGWDLSSHDYVNGTQSLGTFLLVGGLGTGKVGGAQFVPADALLLGNGGLRGFATLNGQPYYTSESLVNALRAAPQDSVTNLTFVGHGDQSSIQIGFTGAFTFTSNGQGGYNFSFNGYSNVNATFSSLSWNASVNFWGCNTASGDMNITRAFSATYPGASVSGYLGDAYAVGLPGFAPVFHTGTAVTYQNGERISGGH